MRAYIYLCRLNRPIGIWLLLWPCFCGLALIYGHLIDYFLFFIGAVALRSTGCIINDWVDQHFDKCVERTKNRPLSAGLLSQKQAIYALVFLLTVGCIIWLQLSNAAKLCSLLAAVMMVIYPFLKRITYWPQLFLGFTFNIGLWIALLHRNASLQMQCAYLYAALICWTMIYDTIYAFADIEDDIRIGVKSSAIKMQYHPKSNLGLWSFLSSGFLFLAFQNIILSLLSFSYLITLLMLWNPKNSKDCIRIFKLCHFWGVGLWLWLEFIRVIAP